MRVRVACACNARAMHVGLFDMQRVKCGVSPIGNGGMRHLQPLIADHNSGRVLEGLSALLGHGYTVDNRAQPEMATFGVFRRRVPPIAMQNRRLPLDHWGQVVVRSDFR